MIPPAGASGTLLLLLLDTCLTFVLELLALSAHAVLSCSAPPRALWAKSLPRWPHPCSLGGSPLWKQPLPSLLRLQRKYGPHSSTLSHARLVAGPLAFRLSQAQADTHQPCVADTKDTSCPVVPRNPLPGLRSEGRTVPPWRRAIPQLCHCSSQEILSLFLSLPPGCGVLG